MADLVVSGVTLRPWGATDAPTLVAAWHDPSIIAGSSPPADRSLHAAVQWIEGAGVREQRLLAVDRVIDLGGMAVGEVGLSDIDQERGAALIGWWIAAGHRGNGHATAGLRAMVELATSLDVTTLVARIGVDNTASIRVAERTGFELLRAGTAAEPHVYVAR